jgi:hypothetical protein
VLEYGRAPAKACGKKPADCGATVCETTESCLSFPTTSEVLRLFESIGQQSQSAASDASKQQVHLPNHGLLVSDDASSSMNSTLLKIAVRNIFSQADLKASLFLNLKGT